MAARVEAIATRPVVKRQAWKNLTAHYKKVRELHLRKLFAEDPKRGELMTAEAVGLFLDYSKNRITMETLKLLIKLAEESGLRGRIDAMFRGEKINLTEKRAVLHIALRAPRDASISVDGENVVPKCMPCSTTWPISPTESGAASGRATPANVCVTWSTLASVAPTWGR
jgi:Phosphoglucose isomerase